MSLLTTISYGKDDELGFLNRLTDDVVKDAAREIKTGTRYVRSCSLLDHSVDVEAHVDLLGYLSTGLLTLKEIYRFLADKSSISISTKRPHVSLTMTHGLSTHRAAANVSPASPIVNPKLSLFSHHQQHSHHTRGRAPPFRLPRSPEILQRCDPRRHSRR